MAEGGGDQIPPIGGEADAPPTRTPYISARVRNLFSGRNRNRSRSRDNPDRIDRVDSESQSGYEDEEEEEREDGEWSVEDLLYRDFMENTLSARLCLQWPKIIWHC